MNEQNIDSSSNIYQPDNRNNNSLKRLHGELPRLVLISPNGGRYELNGWGPNEWGPHEDDRVEAWNAYVESLSLSARHQTRG